MDYDMDIDSSTDNSKKPKIIKSGCNINNYIERKKMLVIIKCISKISVKYL